MVLGCMMAVAGGGLYSQVVPHTPKPSKGLLHVAVGHL